MGDSLVWKFPLGSRSAGWKLTVLQNCLRGREVKWASHWYKAWLHGWHPIHYSMLPLQPPLTAYMIITTDIYSAVKSAECFPFQDLSFLSTLWSRDPRYSIISLLQMRKLRSGKVAGFSHGHTASVRSGIPTQASVSSNSALYLLFHLDSLSAFLQGKKQVVNKSMYQKETRMWDQKNTGNWNGGQCLCSRENLVLSCPVWLRLLVCSPSRSPPFLIYCCAPCLYHVFFVLISSQVVSVMHIVILLDSLRPLKESSKGLEWAGTVRITFWCKRGLQRERDAQWGPRSSDSESGALSATLSSKTLNNMIAHTPLI